jgi:hypothetical protein
MPIRLNLLAEDHAAEEVRRRDPVKRAIWAGALAVALMLAWSSSLQLKAMLANSELARVEAQLGAQTNSYQHVMANRAKIGEITSKLARLQQLTTNRFLNGTLLNTLQQTTVEDVQLIRFRALEEYVITEPVKAKTGENGRVIPAKPGASTEKITLLLDAQDKSAGGDAMTRFKQAVSTNAYFQAGLGRANEARLSNLGSPQTSPDGKSLVPFSLECRYPDKTR